MQGQRLTTSDLQRSIVQALTKLREDRPIIRQLMTLALLGLFTLPLGILVRQLVWEFDGQIKVISQKRIGLSYNNRLMQLLASLLEHRLMVYQLNTSSTTSPKIAWKQQEIDRHLKHLKEQNRLYKISLKTEEYSKKINRDWQLVLKAMVNKNLTRQELYTLQSSIIADVLSEILHVGSTSNLILDDSPDTYYLGDTLRG
jgi:hypothetical protein